MELYIQPVGALQTNCYFLASEAKNAAVFDPGDDFEEIVSALEDLELTPVMIILTHGHFDHVGAVNRLRAEYDIPVYAHKEEVELLTDLKLNRAIYHKLEGDNYLVQPDHLLEEGDTISLDELTMKVLHTPGHTKGGMCVICGNLLFTGDTLFKGECGRCDLAGGDYPTMLASLKKLAALEGDYNVLPGHGPNSTLQWERENNQYMK